MLLPLLGHSQRDTVNLQSSDTSAEQAMQKTVLLFQRIDSLEFADSVNKAVLMRRLEELRAFEKSKRKTIEAELQRLKLADERKKEEMYGEINRLKQNTIGYPIVMHKDTIFTVFTKLGQLTAEERADLVRERLDVLYDEFFPGSDSLLLVDNGASADLYFKEKLILSVTELDALWFERNKGQIARSYRDAIQADILQYSRDRSILKVIREIGLVAIVLLFQIFSIKLVNYLFREKITVFLRNKEGEWFNGIVINKYEVLNKVKQTSIIVFIAKLVRIALIFVLLYLSIPLLFSIFPLTQRLAEALFGYILHPVKQIAHSLFNYIPELVTILVIVTITRYVLKFLRFLSEEVENENLKVPGFFPDWARPTYNIVRFLILAFMFVVIFPYLPGSDSDVFKGVSVFIGVVFSLSSSSIIGNVVAGIVITYMRPFKKNDRVKIGDVVGNVVEKTPFVIRIQTPKKEFITIPNSNVLSQNVINYSNSKLQGGLIVHTTVTIGYDVPWRQVHQILINAAKKTSNLNDSIAPYVLQTSLDDFYVSYQLNAHTNEPDKQPQIYSELHQNIQDGFNEAGVEILSPHYRADRDGNDVAIPPQYRD